MPFAGCDLVRRGTTGGTRAHAAEDDLLGDLPDDMWIDANGAPTELHRTDGIEVVVHHDDLPEQDRTTVGGIPCTAALRTVIDLAPELNGDEMRRVVDDCLARVGCSPSRRR